MYKNKKISGEELEKVEYEDALSMEAAQNEDYFHWCQMNGIDWKPIRSEVESLHRSIGTCTLRAMEAAHSASIDAKTALASFDSAIRAGHDAVEKAGSVKDWAIRETNDLWVKVEHLRTAIRWLSIAAILLGIGNVCLGIAQIMH